jgi:hypothetical protein
VFTFGYDKDSGCLVGLYSGVRSDAANFELKVKAARVLDDECAERSTGHLQIMVLDAGDHAPNAFWRKRFAEEIKRNRCTRMYVAVVTASPLQRGILTAIDWITRDAKRESAAFDNFEAATRWAETRRGEPLPILPGLYDEARAKARAGR